MLKILAAHIKNSCPITPVLLHESLRNAQNCTYFRDFSYQKTISSVYALELESVVVKLQTL